MKLPSSINRYIRISPYLYVYVAALLLLAPLKWLLAAGCAAAIHELSHLAMIYLLGIEVYSVQIGLRGTKIITEPMTDKSELLCAIAGPAGGLLILFFARWIPRVALCAAFQSIYNLLPIYPLDGGRALRCSARLLLTDRNAAFLCNCAEILSAAGMVTVGYSPVWRRLFCSRLQS